MTRSGTNMHGPKGYVINETGSMRLDLAPPVEISEEDTTKTNSFELVAVAYSACLGGAVGRALAMKEIPYDDYFVKVTNNVFADEEKGGKLFQFDITINLDGVEEARKEEVVNLANQLCPFSKAIKGNVKTALKIQ
ncbi:MAG: OsmC family protein [Thermotogota bacterium]